MRDGVGISTEHGIRTDRPRFGRDRPGITASRGAAEWFVTFFARGPLQNAAFGGKASAAPKVTSTGAMIGNGTIFDATSGRGASRSGRSSRRRFRVIPEVYPTTFGAAFLRSAW